MLCARSGSEWAVRGRGCARAWLCEGSCCYRVRQRGARVGQVARAWDAPQAWDARAWDARAWMRGRGTRGRGVRGRGVRGRGLSGLHAHACLLGEREACVGKGACVVVRYRRALSACAIGVHACDVHACVHLRTHACTRMRAWVCGRTHARARRTPDAALAIGECGI